jgi:CBS domain-containing protein
MLNVPVVDSKGILHGLLTFRDIVTEVIYSQADVKKLKVEDIMAKDLVTCIVPQVTRFLML